MATGRALGGPLTYGSAFYFDLVATLARLKFKTAIKALLEHVPGMEPACSPEAIR
jgi:hypothetical protein